MNWNKAGVNDTDESQQDLVRARSGTGVIEEMATVVVVVNETSEATSEPILRILHKKYRMDY